MKKLRSVSIVPLLLSTLQLSTLPSSPLSAQERPPRLERTDWVSVTPGPPSVQLSRAKEIRSGRSTLLIKTITERELADLRAQIELGQTRDRTQPDYVLTCTSLRRRPLDDRDPKQYEGVFRCDGKGAFVEEFLADTGSTLSLYLAYPGEGSVHSSEDGSTADSEPQIEATIVVQPGRLTRQVLTER